MLFFKYTNYQVVNYSNKVLNMVFFLMGNYYIRKLVRFLFENRICNKLCNRLTRFSTNFFIDNVYCEKCNNRIYTIRGYRLKDNTIYCDKCFNE